MDKLTHLGLNLLLAIDLRDLGFRVIMRPVKKWASSSMVEQLTLNQLVQGSIPWGPTRYDTSRKETLTAGVFCALRRQC